MKLKKFIYTLLMSSLLFFQPWLYGKGGDKEVQPAAVITMTNLLKFEPAVVTITAGETVLWKNSSLLVHTVTADSDLVANPENVALPKGAAPFNSGNIEPEGTFQHTFTVPGKYRYFCIPHEAAKMIGEIIVKPKAE